MGKSTADKKECQRQKILQTAFKEWGKNNFCQTSLSSLARRLGITKPALYRYFPSKDELLAAMDSQFLTDYLELLQTYLKETVTLELPQAVDCLTELYYNFFRQQPAYYIFLMRQAMQGSLFKSTTASQLSASLRENLRTTMGRQGVSLSDRELAAGLRYLFTSIIFWLTPLFMPKQTADIFFADGIIPPAAEIKQKAVAYCLAGLLNRRLVKAQPVPYQRIEYHTQASAGRAEILPEDRLFTAIEAVVSQSGLKEASIDKIAAYLGMTKSSLYFYFKNKDDMLGQMMQRKQEYILSQMQQKIRAYEHFTEQSYAYMSATAAMLLERPVLFTIFSWLRFQNIKLNLKPPNKDYLKKFFNFVIEAAASNHLNIKQEEALRAGVLLHALTFSLILEYKDKPEAGAEMSEELRLLHRCYLYGFPGVDTVPKARETNGG